MRGVETYVRLPKAWWPAHWAGKYEDPLCKLLRALYGHPEAGNDWAEKLCSELQRVGFSEVDGWSSVYIMNKDASHVACFVVYVDRTR